jgi:uncharacterized protein
MQIEFDPAKDLGNRAKHGVSLALAPKTNMLYYVAFEDRNNKRRIISLRLANRREVKHYVENI